MGRDQLERERGPVRWRERREGLAIEEYAIGRVEDVDQRPLEGREVRRPGPTGREGLGDRTREKRGELRADVAKGVAPRRMRHQVELREVVERGGPD